MYKFSLEPVLHYRKLLEENLQKEFSESKRRLVAEEKRLSYLEEIRGRALGELQKREQSSCTASDIRLYADYIEQVSRDILGQTKKVIEAKKVCDEKREHLIEAMKGRKTIDKLKERGWKQFKRDLLLKEQNAMNEIAISMFNRRTAPPKD